MKTVIGDYKQAKQQIVKATSWIERLPVSSERDQALIELERLRDYVDRQLEAAK